MLNAQVRNGDASSLRQLINHVSSHMNELQALSLNVPVQDLMLNNLMLATIDPEMQREWDLITASHADTSNDCRISYILGIKKQSIRNI
jgi:hypothetical protein